MQWRKSMTANHAKFNLIIDSEYKGMPQDEYVYNSRGEQLFYFTYDPADIQVYHADDFDIFGLETIQKNNWAYGIDWGHGNPINYNSKGMDCDGVPYFSHVDANYAADFKDVNQFEPLTVGTVMMWLAWFLYRLEKSQLKIN